MATTAVRSHIFASSLVIVLLSAHVAAAQDHIAGSELRRDDIVGVDTGEIGAAGHALMAQALVTGAVAADAECAGTVSAGRRAWCDHKPGLTALRVEVLRTLPRGSLTARALTHEILRDPEGVTLLRNSGTIMGLYLAGNHSDELAAALVRDLCGDCPVTAAAAAHLVRMIGVVRASAFSAILQHPSLSERGRHAVQLDLQKMAAGTKREQLASTLAGGPTAAQAGL